MVGLQENALIFNTRGNIELLSQNKVAVFASRQTPEAMHPDVFEFFDALRRLPIGISSGWQSPMEKLLYKRMDVRQPANVLHYYAMDLNTVKLSKLQENLLKEKKLLLISPETKSLRANKRLIKKRDELLFSQNKKICFLHISKGGRLEEYFNTLLQSGHAVFLLEHPLNEPFYSDGTVLLHPHNLDILRAVV